jgi:hypothetical protein
LKFILTLFALAAALPGAMNAPEPLDRESEAIVDRYVQASVAQQQAIRGATMEVDISAELPKLKKKGKLHALRQISKLGQITYKALGFDGDNTIKKEVIARYLSAETESRDTTKLAVNQVNYKFKYKGVSERDGHRVHILEVSPRRKAVGLFKGILWVDADTFLTVREQGRFVKSPSMFIKRVEFAREFDIRDGVAIPRTSQGLVDTRVWGKAQVSVQFLNFSREEQDRINALFSPDQQ